MNANRLVGEYTLALLTSAQECTTVLIVFFTHPESSLNTLWVIGFVDPAGVLFHAVNPMYIPRARDGILVTVQTKLLLLMFLFRQNIFCSYAATIFTKKTF